MPPTEVQLGIGTIVSPWPPINKRTDVFHADAQFHRQKRAIAGGVQARRPGRKPWRVKSGDLPHLLDHRVKRIADDDHDRVGAGSFDLLGDAGHDLRVGAQQVIAAHARFARDAGGHDDHVAVGRVVVAGGADDVGVEAEDRRGLHQVERFAPRHVLGLGNIEQDDVAEFGGRTPMGTGGSDVSGSDDGDFCSAHGLPFSFYGWDGES